MAFFDTLKPMQFGPIPFPYKSYKIHGGQWHHVHKFPHNQFGSLGAKSRWGGDVVVSPSGIEKFGRELYQFSVQVDFRADLASPKYPQLITDLGNLRAMFENGDTDTLFIPHVGGVQALAIDWTESCINTDRSNVAGTIEFLEDQTSAFLVLEALAFRTLPVSDAAANFAIAPKPSNDIWRKIDGAINAFLAIKDQADLYGSLVASKIDGLIQLLKLADETVKELNDPPWNIELVEALHALWDAMQDLKKDIQRKGDLLCEYTTPVRMGISQVAAAIYGDTERAIDLLQLNVIADPHAIPANTVLKYYRAA